MANESTKRKLQKLLKEIAIGSDQADKGQFVKGKAVFTAVRKRSARRKLAT